MLSGFSHTCCLETSNRDPGNDFGKNEDQKPTALKSSALNTPLLFKLLGDRYILEGLEFYCQNRITVTGKILLAIRDTNKLAGSIR